MNIAFYQVNGCKVTTRESFNGIVLNINNESITDSIKRKLGVNKLLCESTNEGFQYNKVVPYTVPLSALTIGEFMLLDGKGNMLINNSNS